MSVLRSEMSYCQVRAIDGEKRLMIENEWAFVAGRHLIHLECQIRTGDSRGVIRPGISETLLITSWESRHDLIFTPEAGKRYLVKDFVDSANQEYAWIEEIATSEIVSGSRPAVFEGPDRYTDEEIAEAIETLGEGSSLVVRYTAPKKPVKRFEVRVKNLVVVETSGNEDFEAEIPIAPGFYIVKVDVESEKDHGDYSQFLDLDLEPGQIRTLVVKGKAWGRAQARIK